MFAAFEQGCELRAAVQRQSDDRVALFYELRNKRDATLLVFDSVEPPESPYYVERTASGIAIAQKVVSPPRGLELERPEIPLASRVEPGGRLRVKLDLPLPLRERLPYSQLTPRRPPAGQYLVLEAWLEVGICELTAELPAKEIEGGVALARFGPGLQTVVRTGPIGRFAFDPSR